MENKTFEVPNIGCDGCVRTIQNELGDLMGVTSVSADQDTRMVTISYAAPATWAAIVNKLTEIDYAPAAV